MMMPTVDMIVMVAVAMAASIRAAFGLKRRVDHFELGSKTMQHLFDHVIGPDAERVRSNLRWQMPVSKMPGDAQQLMGIFMTDLDDRFGGSFDPQPGSVVKLQSIAIGHRDCFRKIEKDVFSVVRREANAAAMARVEIKCETADGLFCRPVSSGAMNGSVVHGD